MASMQPPTTAATSFEVATSDIARRAFELYCNRGYKDGYDVDDWLNAERELRAEPNSSAA
jgi:hypothetical protein